MARFEALGAPEGQTFERHGVKALHSDGHPLPLPVGHRFPQSRYRLLRVLVEGKGDLELVESPPAGDDLLALAHSPDYVRAVVSGGLLPAEQRAIGFLWSEAMVERSCRSAGATCEAADTALREGVAANLAGGTHHASADRGSGYCVFNDVAVASRPMQMRAAPASLRVADIDLDVHQGDGTARIFEGGSSVFTLSLHGEKNFPFRKARSDLDVELPDGCGGADYLAALDGGLDVLLGEHERAPFCLAFYLAGADPHEDDRLGRLKLSAGGLLERDRRVLRMLRERRIPAAMAMAGGYGKDIDVTVAIQGATIDAAIASWREWNNARR